MTCQRFLTPIGLFMFIYSLPLLFSQIKMVNPVELLIIFLGLWVVLWLSSPIRAEAVQFNEKPSYLFGAWTGCVDLKWVCWPFFIILNICLYTADTLAKLGLLTVSSWDDVHIMLLLPIVWWSTSVWRCSANTDIRLGSSGARLMIFAVLFEYGLKLLIRIDYPRIFFGCEELLLDYGSFF